MKFRARSIIKTAATAALAMFVLCTCAFADTTVILPVGKLSDALRNTPKENVFCTQSAPDKRFVLLDSDNDGYLVLADEIYLLREFDPDGTQKFDTEDENNIAYYLNNEFLNEDYIPSEIIKYIDFDREWKTEGGSLNGNCPKEYSQRCGVSLLGYTEFLKYYNKFGMQCESLKQDWYLRSPLAGEASDTGVIAGGTYANEGKLSKSITSIKQGIKPVFWLKKDFFKNVKMNVIFTGENVAKLIRKNNRLESIKKEPVGYSDYELKRLGYGVSGLNREYVKIFAPNEPTYIQNTDDAYVDVTVNISGGRAKEYVVEYSPDGTFNDGKAETLKSVPLKNNTLRLDLSKEKRGRYPYFSVRVSGADGIVALESYPITLLDIYQKQNMDEYSKIGMNLDVELKTDHDRSEDYFNYMIRVMGISKVRGNIRWSWNESPKGTRTYSKHQYWYDEMIKYNQEYCPYILGYGNKLYFDTEPRTYQNIKDTIGYNTDILEYFDKMGLTVENFEIWNEPNLPTFWGGPCSSVAYSQLANRMGFEMNRLYPDKEVIGCGIASQNGEQFIDDYYKYGGLMYTDGFSCHPYTYPNDPDARHYKRASDFVFRRYEAGGWVTVSQTEVGYPTHTGQGGIADDVQAVYIPKLYIYNDELDVDLTNLYVLDDIGENDTYNEHNFGIMDYNFLPKDSVVSMAQLTKYCANAEYIGRYPINDNSHAYVYTKLNKTFAVIWSTGDKYEYELENGAKAENHFGDVILPTDNKISIGSEPVYISDISNDLATKATAYQVSETVKKIKDEYGGILDLSGIDEVKQKFDFTSVPSADELKKSIDYIYDFGVELIKRYKADENKPELKKLTAALFRLEEAAEKAAAFYASFDYTNEDSDSYVNAMKEMIADIKGDEPESSLLFTDAIMRFANRYNQKANAIADVYDKKDLGIRGAIAENDLLAKNICKWAEMVCGLEERDTSRAIFTYLQNSAPTVYQGEDFEYYVETENLRTHDIDGEIVWRDNNLNALGEPRKCYVKSGECIPVTYGGHIDTDFPLGTKTFFVDITEDGKLLKRIEINTTVKGVISVELEKSTKTLDELATLDVKYVSTFNKKFTGKVSITAPEGWALEYDNADITLEPNEVKSTSIKILKAQKQSFNDYYFGFKVSDSNGREMLNKEIPLDFHVAVKSKNEIDISNFDGDISDWEDAYPIHINTPENPSSIESWKKSNIAAKALCKWDENYFYALVDVYDDLYLQTYAGANIWMGDSIQLAFDTLNDKAASFGGDDYEYGYSYTASGLEIQGFLVGTGKTTGTKTTDWVRIVRDNNNHITRYAIKMPKDELTPMNLKEGTMFGYNICANDADILERDSYIQYSGGIADKKNPSAFNTFVLKGVDSRLPEETEDTGFIKRIDNTGFSGFAD